MPDIKLHNCGYSPCVHKITLEEWAVAHPDDAWELLSELPEQTRMAAKLRDALSGSTPGGPK